MERLVDAITPLGDALWFRQMTGTEALSVPFEFDLTFHSKQLGLSAKAMLGKDVTLKVETEGGKGVRHFNGICTRFMGAGRDGEHQTTPQSCAPGSGSPAAAATAKSFNLRKSPTSSKRSWANTASRSQTS
jgi:type VI secretion system secreted protein VgrG